MVVLRGGCILLLGCPNTLGHGCVALNPKNVIIPGGWLCGGGVIWWLYTCFRLSDLCWVVLNKTNLIIPGEWWCSGAGFFYRL